MIRFSKQLAKGWMAWQSDGKELGWVHAMGTETVESWMMKGKCTSSSNAIIN